MIGHYIFWHITQRNTKNLSDNAITKFFPSTFTYLCAQDFAVFVSINEERNRIDAQLCFLLAVIFIHKNMNQLKIKPAPSISLRKAFPMKFIIHNYYLSRFMSYFYSLHPLFTSTNNICYNNQIRNIFLYSLT